MYHISVDKDNLFIPNIRISFVKVESGILVFYIFMANYDYMEIKKVISDKKEFLELLLLTDEQEDMIDRYLDRGDMFVLYDNGLRAACVVTREGENFFTDNYDHPIYEEVNYPYIGVKR